MDRRKTKCSGEKANKQRCTNPECKRLRDSLREEIRRLKSVSYDMAKQTGDWQCGGKTHEDHSAAFDTLFLGRVEDLSSLLQTSAGLKTGEARQMLCQLFQMVYERCRGRVLDTMRMSLSEVGSVPTTSEMSVNESEALHDACRAYGLLLHSSQLKQVQEHQEISSQVHRELMRAQERLSAAEAELQKFTAKVAEVSWGLLTTVPPLVVSQPSHPSRRYHQTENWDSSLGPEQELTYFRPVLFSSYEGRVAQKGWVTNRAMGHPTNITGLLGNEIGSAPKPDDLKHMSRSQRHHRREHNYSDLVVVGAEEQHQMHGVQTALSDLLAGRRREEEGGGEGEGEGEGEMEGGGGKEDGGIQEALPLLRLTNR